MIGTRAAPARRAVRRNAGRARQRRPTPDGGPARLPRPDRAVIAGARPARATPGRTGPGPRLPDGRLPAPRVPEGARPLPPGVRGPGRRLPLPRRAAPEGPYSLLVTHRGQVPAALLRRPALRRALTRDRRRSDPGAATVGGSRRTFAALTPRTPGRARSAPPSGTPSRGPYLPAPSGRPGDLRREGVSARPPSGTR
ncbi:hypothetical protein GCM10010398_58610 [Streptomyces fimbriatus]